MALKIWCPGCEWRPQPSSRWWCTPPGCGHVWNTFDTGGVCPQCSKIWQTTQCLSCKKRYPHVEWYHDEQSTGSETDTEADTPVEAGDEAPVELTDGLRSPADT